MIGFIFILGGTNTAFFILIFSFCKIDFAFGTYGLR